MNRQDLQNRLSDLQRKVDKMKNDFPTQDFRTSYLEIERIRKEIGELTKGIGDYVVSFESRYEPNLHQFKNDYSQALNLLWIDLNELIHQEYKFNSNNKNLVEILSPCITLFVGLLPIAALCSAIILFFYLSNLGLANVFPLIVYDIGLIPIISLCLILILFFVWGFILFSVFNDKNHKIQYLLFCIVVFGISVVGFLILTQNTIISLTCAVLWTIIILGLSILKKKMKKNKDFRENIFIDLFSVVLLCGIISIGVLIASELNAKNNQPMGTIFLVSRITESDTKIFKFNTNFSKNLNASEKIFLAQMFRDESPQERKVEINYARCQPVDDYLVGHLMIKTKNIHVLCPVGKELSKNQTIGQFCYQFSAGGDFGDDLIDVTAICQAPPKQK